MNLFLIQTEETRWLWAVSTGLYWAELVFISKLYNYFLSLDFCCQCVIIHFILIMCSETFNAAKLFRHISVLTGNHCIWPDRETGSRLYSVCTLFEFIWVEKRLTAPECWTVRLQQEVTDELWCQNKKWKCLFPVMTWMKHFSFSTSFFFTFFFCFFYFLHFDLILYFSLYPSCLLPAFFFWSSINHFHHNIYAHEHFLLQSFCSTKILFKSIFSLTGSCFCSPVHSLLFFLLRLVFSARGDKEGRFSCFQKVGERTQFVWQTLWWTWWVSERERNVAVVSDSGLKNAEAVTLLL